MGSDTQAFVKQLVEHEQLAPLQIPNLIRKWAGCRSPRVGVFPNLPSWRQIPVKHTPDLLWCLSGKKLTPSESTYPHLPYLDVKKCTGPCKH